MSMMMYTYDEKNLASAARQRLKKSPSESALALIFHATASSGLMDLPSSLPLKKLEVSFTTGVRGIANKDDLRDIGFVGFGVVKELVDRLHCGAQEILAELLETRMRKRGVKVDALEESTSIDV
ncbi:hypothetical protein FISHEDRAFT_62889 [Fistulina hepatica ATCC 64428]|uniref:Uncharacterized protein n=1 Tax=Fistulina hepatica ATCC 64428 TaxID=1128425 RepID=A0A0D7A2S6_9AGAR|nr:hypothetical protein FISHEDRAFT_62889 [Fistulina hepatica ATCC 64428]